MFSKINVTVGIAAKTAILVQARHPAFSEDWTHGSDSDNS